MVTEEVFCREQLPVASENDTMRVVRLIQNSEVAKTFKFSVEVTGSRVIILCGFEFMNFTCNCVYVQCGIATISSVKVSSTFSIIVSLTFKSIYMVS